MDSDQIVTSNKNNIESILRVLRSRSSSDMKVGNNSIILSYYEKLGSNPVMYNPKIVACIHELFDYPASKPGKIYVWIDNLINLHNFITGKTYIFRYSYPDPKKSQSILWCKECHYDTDYKLIKISRNKCESNSFTLPDNKRLTKLLDL